ncbi:MAG TPA: TetR/AcrR family transcriptional regulator [Acidimicrobiia bacterium]|nr:TetR/AcrR family transcriptional regulator [Acidimicrobiia bacterium]
MAGRTKELRRAVSDEEKELRRETILAAAKRVFSQKGYAATTVADVARAAKLSYGTIYWYFESKEELFDALMDAGEQSLRSHILAALEAAGPADLEGALRTAVGATFEHFDTDRDAARLLFRDSYALGGRFERHLLDIYEGFVRDLQSTIEEGQRSGAVRAVPSRMVAFSLAALIGQLAYRRLTTDDGMDAASLAEFVVSMVMDGLRPR